MAAIHPSNTPKQSTSLIPGRLSTSSLAGYSGGNLDYSQGIGYSPSAPASSSASSGIPSFRSLRSLLPFGPNKNASTSTSSPNNVSRSPFSGAFGSVRRSMTKDCERKVSLSNDAMMSPVMAIEKSNSEPLPDDTAVIRRSASFSNFDKPLPTEPSSPSSPCGDDSRFTLRTSSPDPPLSADLSTIIEADNSGVSKHVAANPNPKGNDNPHGSPTHERDPVGLSTTREGDSLEDRWSTADEVAIIVDDDPDTTSDPAASKQVPLQTPNKVSSNPTTPNLLASPASRLPRARHPSSFLPRLRSSNSTSPSPTPVPKPSSSIVVNGNGHNAPRLLLSSSPATTPSLQDRDERRTPVLRVVDTTTTAVRDKVSKIPNPSTARTRKRSMSLQEKFGNEDVVRSGSSLSSYTTKTSGGGGGVESGSSVNESSASSGSGSKMDWLGPRTAKAFRAAGLLDFDREKERDREEGSEPTERLRDRSSSTSGVLSPSPLGVGNPAAILNRFASLRSTSEYNPAYGRSHSRLTLSEVSGATPRRGSESLSAYGGASSHSGNGGGSLYGHRGLMESPTFTASSGSRGRDTPKSSTSTAPTSLADSFGYLGRDRSERDLNKEREREREEMREMKEKHGTEMGALLGALSDSQRTVRMLREENSDLRDRLERFTVAVQANQELRQVYGDLQSECSSLRRENIDLRKELKGLTHSWSGSGLRIPMPKAAISSSSSPLARTSTSRLAHEEEEYDDTFIVHGSEVEKYLSNKDIILPPPSSPGVSSKKRRLSTSSSIFPIPPSNMTLLLHEDVTSTLGSIASCNVGDHAQYGFSLPPPNSTASRKTPSNSPPPISYLNFVSNIPPNSSVTSVGSMSPSTANFSMVTGSPGSLFLRPEHEILLGDMESLDLGVRSGDGDSDEKADGW